MSVQSKWCACQFLSEGVLCMHYVLCYVCYKICKNVDFCKHSMFIHAQGNRLWAEIRQYSGLQFIVLWNEVCVYGVPVCILEAVPLCFYTWQSLKYMIGWFRRSVNGGHGVQKCMVKFVWEYELTTLNALATARSTLHILWIGCIW